jgi:hypothetical protein
MKNILIAVSLLSVTLLSACSAENPVAVETKQPASSAIDAAVAMLLPHGAFAVTGGFSNSEGPTTAIEGFVKYGTDLDGKDCESEYTVTDLKHDPATSSFTTKQRSVRTVGASGLHQDISDPAKPGEWVDHADPASPQIALLFVPNLIADDYGVGPVDGAGNGQLCAIPLLARTMKLSTGELTNGELAFDTKRAEATSKARSDRWAERYIDAVGVTGPERETAVELLKELSLPNFSTTMERTRIKITRTDDGSYEIVQMQPTGFVSVRLLFTPTAERSIEPVSGKTYFAKVAEEVKASGLTPLEFLDKDS